MTFKKILSTTISPAGQKSASHLSTKKVLQLKEKGYLTSDVVKGERFAEKAIYSITDAGRAYFETLMDTIAEQNVPLTFDFNVVITNLNKMDRPQGKGG